MMNVLVLGDEHSHGCGLRPKQRSYVTQLIRQVSQTGQSIQVEVCVPPTTGCLVDTLNQLVLQQYDLILVQTERFADELNKAMFWPGWSWRKQVSVPLSELLTRLRPFRHTVVLITPLPHPNRAIQQRRNWLRKYLVGQADCQLFSLFDTSVLLPPHPDYFLTDDSPMLNATSHELLGRSLYAFYQSSPTIVTIQPIRRG